MTYIPLLGTKTNLMVFIVSYRIDIKRIGKPSVFFARLLFLKITAVGNNNNNNKETHLKMVIDDFR